MILVKRRKILKHDLWDTWKAPLVKCPTLGFDLGVLGLTPHVMLCTQCGVCSEFSLTCPLLSAHTHACACVLSLSPPNK